MHTTIGTNFGFGSSLLPAFFMARGGLWVISKMWPNWVKEKSFWNNVWAKGLFTSKWSLLIIYAVSMPAWDRHSDREQRSYYSQALWTEHRETSPFFPLGHSFRVCGATLNHWQGTDDHLISRTWCSLVYPFPFITINWQKISSFPLFIANKPIKCSELN